MPPSISADLQHDSKAFSAVASSSPSRLRARAEPGPRRRAVASRSSANATLPDRSAESPDRERHPHGAVTQALDDGEHRVADARGEDHLWQDTVSQPDSVRHVGPARARRHVTSSPSSGGSANPWCRAALR